MSKQEQKMSTEYKSQLSKESLSAFIDAEQSDIETSLIIDKLLNDSDFKEQYVQMQLINDHLQEQAQENISLDSLRSNISGALDGLPAHFSEDAVSLNNESVENIPQSTFFKNLFQNVFKKSADNKVLSGLSVAASVMLVTLFTLQTYNADINTDLNSDIGDFASVASEQKTLNVQNTEMSVSKNHFESNSPSLIQLPSALPASFVSTTSNLSDVNSQTFKENYQWVEADPALSRKVRQYINEHEKNRAAYNLQPQIRTATYQVIE